MSTRPSEPDRVGTAPTGAVRDIDRYRNYLMLLARSRLSPKLWARESPSDVVQNTLCDAHQALGQFRGSTSGEMAAWLGTILARRVLKVARDNMRDIRDVRREVSLWQKVEESSVMLLDQLAVGSSPSQQADRNEQLLHLAEALAKLPDAQREAIELRYFHHWSSNDIAEHLGRTRGAVGGLVARGLAELKKLLAQTE